MHMADALLSPVVGTTFWVVSSSLIGVSARKITGENCGSKTVLMGVLGAFVFAAQMINFSIPGTGSSGHIGGGILLAVLLGPWRAFITLASVLVIQALFFADGGLLALGCNIFNMGFFTAFVAFPFIYKPIAGDGRSPGRLAGGSVAAATAGLLTGSFSVVAETSASGISDLPFGTFILFMLPIHLAIGIVEGLLTWGVLSFVQKTEPALLAAAPKSPATKSGLAVAALLFATLATGGVISWFASSSPDGLEWSISRVTGKEEMEAPAEPTHAFLARLQHTLAFMPDYDFLQARGIDTAPAVPQSPVKAGTSVAGIVGSIMVLLVAGTAGLLLRKRSGKSVPS
jgi:cobalt/nickel transport system permease protein